MTPLTDRQRVELIVPVLMLQDTVKDRAAEPQDVGARDAYARLMATIVDVVADLQPDRRSKMIRRAGRVFQEATAPLRKEGACMIEFGAATFHLIQRLVDEGILIVGEASNLQRALDVMLPELDAAAEGAGLAPSADRSAGKLLRRLQDLGYYREAVSA